MGGNAHSTEVKVETADATTTVSAPDDADTEAKTTDEAPADSE